LDAKPGGPAKPEVIMGPAIVHAQIRSSASDARAFFGQLFGWTHPTEGAFPGYTFAETGCPARSSPSLRGVLPVWLSKLDR
jgi:hypothetical protein